MNKVAVLVYEGFTLFEIAVAINILSRKYLIDFVSVSSGPVRSEEGMQVVPDQVITPALVVDYAGLVVPGAADMQAILDSEAALEVIQAFDRAGKMVAAICGAAALLGKAGVLKGAYTVTFTREQRKFLGVFREENFHYVPVVEHENIITAQGHAFAEFGIRVGQKLNAIENLEGVRKFFLGVGNLGMES